MAVGSGMMFTYIPFTLANEGYPNWIAASAVTAIAAGGVIGCLAAGPLIRRVGHARVYACFAALMILSMAIIALDGHPYTWLVARFLYGIAANGNFIVTQSWLNHSADNSWRGRAMSVFYMSFIVALGFGSFLFGVLPNDGSAGPVLSVMFCALGILPISLTRLPTPPPPERVTIDLKKTWSISPVGLVGILASGGLSMLVQGFTPIYAAGNGFGQTQIALLMFLMQLGMLVVQVPLGALSDRMDRRLVLLITCILITATAFVASILPFASLILVAFIFAIWSGSTESVYSISNAHANDRADPAEFVTLASTMLVVWSASAFVIPGFVTAMTPIFGPKVFMYTAIVIAVFTAVFIAYRLTQRGAVPEAEAENFELRTAQVANAEILVNPEDGEPDLSLPS